ncbi:MAG: hypothetical protein EAX87_01430 [Candidatus Thorarchaeota archaeon]|nr:hypothetical protein [Candidatus Thorarchaeota archaeon]
MANRARVTVDWLRKGRMVEDLSILRHLIADSSAWDVENAILDEDRFEEVFNLRKLPDSTSSQASLIRTLGYDRVPYTLGPMKPFGSTLRKQVSSLFPSNLNSMEKDVFSYAFARFVLDDVPSDLEWPLVPEGLDSLSAALFTLHYVSRLIGEETAWLVPLWTIKVEEWRVDCLHKIHNLLISDCDIEHAIDEIQEIKTSLKEMLIQDKTIGTGIVQQDPLADEIIAGWLKKLSDNRESTRHVISETRHQLASKVLKEIEVRKKPDLQPVSLTQWNVHALRPDGPTATTHEQMLKMFRGNINILESEPLVKMCQYLSNVEMANRPTAADVEKVTGTKRRMSHYILQRLGLVLTERYIPTMSLLGLKYRFIFTERQRQKLVTESLLKRLALSESNFEGCTIHIEPQESLGPSEDLPMGSTQLTANSELVSLRMDLFNADTQQWTEPNWDEDSATRRRSKGWLKRETQQKRRQTHLTNREVDLLGPLLAFQGLKGSRMWMLSQLGFPLQTARRYLRRLLEMKVLRLLYTPALEFCGIPEGMIVGAKFRDKQLRDFFLDWATNRIPYVRAYTNEGTDLVALIRLPQFKTDLVGAKIRTILTQGSKKDRITSEAFTARLRYYKSYMMTAFQRIYKDNEFLDPWVS